MYIDNYKIHTMQCSYVLTHNNTMYGIISFYRTCTFVSPAIGATLHTFFERRVLIIALFPTLG